MTAKIAVDGLFPLNVPVIALFANSPTTLWRCPKKRNGCLSAGIAHSW